MLKVYSIKQPHRPVLIDIIDVPSIDRIAIHGGRFAVFDTQITGHLAWYGSLDTARAIGDAAVGSALIGASKLAIDGSLMAAITSSGELQIWDISDAASPQQLSGYQQITPLSMRAVAISGRAAYVALSSGALLVFDLAQPDHPALKTTLAFPSNANDLQVRGGHLYCACGGELRVLSLADPLRPQSLGTLTVPGTIARLQIDGDSAYLALSGAGLATVSVANKSAPVLLGSIAGQAADVVVRDDIAYLASSDGVRVVDVSTPSAPVLLATIDTGGPALGVLLTQDGLIVTRQNDLLFMTIDGRTTLTIRATTPVVGTAPPPVTSIAARRAITYISYGSGGVRSFWYRPPTSASLGAAGGELRSAPDGVAYTFAPGALGGSSTVTHRPLLPGSLPAQPLPSLGLAFETSITAGAPAQAAQASFRIVAPYSDEERGPLAESKLALYRWDGAAWVRMAGSVVDAAANTVTLEGALPGTYALLGDSHRIYLPQALALP